MKNMSVLRKDVAEHILSSCPARTKEALRERFGISYNTFRKIEQGAPLRRSLAMRLESELLQADPYEAGGPHAHGRTGTDG